MRLPVLIATVAVLFPATDMQAQTASGKKVLVAYFSHSGNTREMARQIAEATNGEMCIRDRQNINDFDKHRKLVNEVRAEPEKAIG